MRLRGLPQCLFQIIESKPRLPRGSDRWMLDLDPNALMNFADEVEVKGGESVDVIKTCHLFPHLFEQICKRLFRGVTEALRAVFRGVEEVIASVPHLIRFLFEYNEIHLISFCLNSAQYTVNVYVGDVGV